MDCIYCKIIEGALPSKKVFENDLVIAIHDIKPAAPIHVLLIPKKHIPSLNDVNADDLKYISEIHSAAQTAAKELGVSESGYRIVNNCGPDSGQEIFHLHYHLLGGERLGQLNV
jgi:histidine triad (HIT) family protein